MNRMPTFLIIGAAKAGTTALYMYLNQHPQIFMSEKKEPHFFSFENTPITFRGPRDEQAWKKLAVTELDAYQALFHNVTDHIALGEASTNYLYYHQQTAPRIKHYIPYVKLIAVLRNPVDRAYSAYLHRRSEFREPCAVFSEALDAEPERINAGWGPSAHYFRGGLYYEALRTYFDLFDADQRRVYLYDDLVENPHGMVRDIFEYLGVDGQFQPDFSRRYNVSGPISNPILARLQALTLYTGVFQTLMRVLPQFMVRPIRQAYRNARDRSKVKPPISTHDYQRLKAAYHDDVLQVQALIGRDLSAWLR